MYNSFCSAAKSAFSALLVTRLYRVVEVRVVGFIQDISNIRPRAVVWPWYNPEEVAEHVVHIYGVNWSGLMPSSTNTCWKNTNDFTNKSRNYQICVEFFSLFLLLWSADWDVARLRCNLDIVVHKELPICYEFLLLVWHSAMPVRQLQLQSPPKDEGSESVKNYN